MFFNTEGLAPAKLLWKGTAVLGLEIKPTQWGKYLLVPWARIYDAKDEVINNMIEMERDKGTAHTLEIFFREPLSSKFPVDLEFQPEFQPELEYDPRRSEKCWYKWIKENHFRLHVSAKATEEGGDKHVLVLETRKESIPADPERARRSMLTRFLGYTKEA